MDIEKLNEAIRTIRDICKNEKACHGCPLLIVDEDRNYKQCALATIPERWKEL